MELQKYTADSPSNTISEALRHDGAVIVLGLATETEVKSVKDELRNQFDQEGKSFESDFNGYKTLRLSKILARSPSSAALIGNDKMMKIIDPLLLPHCINYQIGSTTGIDIQPGEGSQTLHTDGEIYPLKIPGIEWQVSVLWALSDFTKENGATRVLPGSHRHLLPGDMIDKNKAVQAEMPMGSALFYLGSVLHGGGANQSSKPRMALVNTYSLGWLRQEVNQYLTVSREIIMKQPLKVQRLMGYQGHGPFLGRFEEDPDNYWQNKFMDEQV